MTPATTHILSATPNDDRRIVTYGRDWPDDCAATFLIYLIDYRIEGDGNVRYDALGVETGGLSKVSARSTTVAFPRFEIFQANVKMNGEHAAMIFPASGRWGFSCRPAQIRWAAPAFAAR